MVRQEKHSNVGSTDGTATHTALSAGVLALAFGVGVPFLAAVPAHAAECGGGLLSGVTNSVCDVADSATHVVSGATDAVGAAAGSTVGDTVGGTVEDAVGAVGDTVDTTVSRAGRAVGDTVKDAVGGTVGDSVGRAVDAAANKVGGTVGGTTDTAGASVGAAVDATVSGAGGGGAGAAAGAAPGAGGVVGGLAEAVHNACLPLVAGPRCDRTTKGFPSRTPPPDSTPTPAPEPRNADGTTEDGTFPTESPQRRIGGPESVDWGQRLIMVDREIDVDDAGITLLWPGQYVPGLVGRLDGEKIRPRPAHDGAGTALTAALLLSAVLAARVVSARRAKAGRQESIPFDGMHLPDRGTGRHRLA
jgi:hypothetical protein